MSEKPILFSGPMVQAIATGTKTQTRRVCRVQPEPWRGYYMEAPADPSRWTPGQYEDGSWDLFCGHAATDVPGFGKSPYGYKGDRLWVRETWAKVPATAYAQSTGVTHRTSPDGYYWAVYRTGWERSAPRWTPSIHMPRWASRIELAVTSVRIERLHSITTDDIIAEGVTVPDVDYSVAERPDFLDAERDSFARAEFRALWDGINGKRPGCSWADNPWVWCVSFDCVQTGQEPKTGASE